MTLSLCQQFLEKFYFCSKTVFLEQVFLSNFCEDIKSLWINFWTKKYEWLFYSPQSSMIRKGNDNYLWNFKIFKFSLIYFVNFNFIIFFVYLQFLRFSEKHQSMLQSWLGDLIRSYNEKSSKQKQKFQQFSKVVIKIISKCFWISWGLNQTKSRWRKRTRVSSKLVCFDNKIKARFPQCNLKYPNRYNFKVVGLWRFLCRNESNNKFKKNKKCFYFQLEKQPTAYAHKTTKH